ncbi:MAG TPA: flagellar motor switch protein FliN [Bryobacteraceae bacterium]|nr:flagellar motor switch protein FliN [Bryobacteraceae bacterium]
MNEISQWLAERWAAGLAASIASMAGERPAVEIGPSARPSDDILWWQHGLREIPQSAIWSGAHRTDWFGAGKWTLANAGIDAIEEADARNTWIEVVNQSAAAVATDIASRLGTSVQPEDGSEGSPPEAAEVFAVGITVKAEHWTALVAFSPALVTALSPAQQTTTATPAQIDATGSVLALEALPRRDAGAGVPKALDLLLDVELPVSVSFGRAQLPLKDVLKLTTGAIVELNRTIRDAVEVIVNNCVIARGEVVVVEGNYGVRIREIVSRENRMRSLR